MTPEETLRQGPLQELLGCKHPIQMVGIPGIATPQLVSAVANAGGVGMLSSALLTPDTTQMLIETTTGLTSGPIGMNFLIPFLDRDCLQIAAEKLPLIEFFYGTPAFELVRQVQAAGAICAWQTGSVAEAEEAVRVGCDVVIIQGIEAGGHIRGQQRLDQTLEAVVRESPRPVIAAGGMATGAALAKALQLGAAGVRIGTRFVTANESGAHPDYVEALLGANAQDTQLTEAFSEMWPNAPHRVLSSAIENMRSGDTEDVGSFPLGEKRLPVKRGSVIGPTTETEGDIGAMALYAGESVEHIRQRQSAREIIDEILKEATQALETETR